ncbi:MAG TPA: CDP-alcohol phosphatidyltransferase family protein [Nitrospirae bacterium]|nr:CDP-alcohol phosphatidyltransferase [bacterium BMS3Bbin08]HDO26080.1 CDP-alcohol phosphatidyltransferase family protein [Nitrospirota bacterium]
MTEFGGDKKVGTSILGKFEKSFVEKYVDRIPPNIETYHLTMMTLVWSAGAVLFGYLSSLHIFWIWGLSLMLVFQYLTDLFDGAIGRHRDTGLVKWGFYMDHFLDFIFSCSLVIAYALMAPEGMDLFFFFLLVLSGGFLVNSYLLFASTNEFRIYYYGLGPTEIRLGYIIMNTVIFIYGVEIFRVWVPIILMLNVITLSYLVYMSQKTLWTIDMENKDATSARAE